MIKSKQLDAIFKSEERYGMNENMRIKTSSKNDTKNRQMIRLIWIRAQCTAYRKIFLIL